MQINPERDIMLDRFLQAPPALVWRCWTEPDLFHQWYLPKPWHASNAVLDLRPGGRFSFQVNGPEGDASQAEGSFLEVIPERKLVFTDLFGPDYAPFEMPDSNLGPNFNAILTFASEGSGTRYRAVARHRNAKDAAMNKEMGFEAGWAMTADQLEALAVTL